MRTAQPRELKIVWTGPGELRHEAALHRLLSQSRLPKSEWFEDSDLIRIVVTLLPFLGLESLIGHTPENLCGFVPLKGPQWWAINSPRKARDTYWPDHSGVPYSKRADLKNDK